MLGLYKSNLTVVQNGRIQKLPHGCPKWGRGVKATLRQCPKEKRFFNGFPEESSQELGEANGGFNKGMTYAWEIDIIKCW